MDERRHAQRARTFRGGKILLNNRRSVVGCTVRNLSDTGACLQVESIADIPDRFDLAIEGDELIYPCRLMWTSENRIGVSFPGARADSPIDIPEESRTSQAVIWNRQRRAEDQAGSGDLMRGELLRLRAALDEVRFGVVLLDSEMRAQFINRAFRKMWRLPDSKADSKPAFVALMYHGRDTRAYEIPERDLDAYVAERVAHVKAGHPMPRDLRLANGEVVRFQCIVLPSGGRMLTYNFVTDIVRHSDELELLRGALDMIGQGVVLLDPQFRVRFINTIARKFWDVSDEQVARGFSYIDLVNNGRTTNYDVAPEMKEAFIARRIALVRAGDSTPSDLRMNDGRTIRAQCTTLANGGRMLTYTDVSDLVRQSEDLARLATSESMTGLYNRRHFVSLGEAEWDRFQRYHRPLSLLFIDVDHFKEINDRFGHDVGDLAILHVADVIAEDRRATDIISRFGGDEFAMLLPETDIDQARVVAERIRARLNERPLALEGQAVPITLSIGLAEASLSMSSLGALIKLADRMVYEAKSAGRDRIQVPPPPAGEVKFAAE
ncbi:MAG: diguanylate cyclase [Afipia sp.]